MHLRLLTARSAPAPGVAPAFLKRSTRKGINAGGIQDGGAVGLMDEIPASPNNGVPVRQRTRQEHSALAGKHTPGVRSDMFPQCSGASTPVPNEGGAEKLVQTRLQREGSIAIYDGTDPKRG